VKAARELEEAILAILSAGRYEGRKGFLQSLSPASRLLLLLVLQVFIVTINSIGEVVSAIIIVLLLVVASRVSLKELLIQTAALTLPFTLIIATPALFIKPSESLLPSFSQPTLNDFMRVALFVLRVFLAVTNMLLLVHVAGIPSLACSLSYLRLPSSLTLLLTLTYIHVLTMLRNLRGKLLGYEARFGGSQRELRVAWRDRLSAFFLLLVEALSFKDSLTLALRSRGAMGGLNLACKTPTLHEYMLVVLLALFLLLVKVVAP